MAGAAAHACASCKKNKRRCDKTLPSCSLCLRTGRHCDYSEYPQSSNSDEVNELRNRIQELEEHILSSASQTPSSFTPSSFTFEVPDTSSNPQPLLSQDLHIQASYLDIDVFSSTVANNANQVLIDPSTVLGINFDIDNVKSQYFQTIHTWMPIISKIRLNRLTQDTQGAMKADIVLLLLCIKLIQETPQNQHTASSGLYSTAKYFAKDLELKGVLTLRTVQAGLLLAVYELGHGIFHAAFMTIGCCARQAVAIGLHNRLAPQTAGKLRTWVDWEERQRVWWMIVTLDRYVALGSDYRPLCTEDPSKDSLLPANDRAWDAGEMVPPERVSLASGSNSSVTPFARLAQASNLLGRVIRHCNDTTLELQYALDDYEMLSQAIYSLVDLLVMDASPSSETSIASAICFSALLKLANNHACDMLTEESQCLEPDIAPRVRECMQKCLNTIKDVAGRVLLFSQNLGQILSQNRLDSVSPLVLHCIYACAVDLSWMALETENEEYTAGKLACVEILRTISSRWKVAGVYLELLRISEIAECN
ncbi:hypothetical protein ASPWEDRAFT_183896 [Aspergillus wentii DTO 134E9]|uniref:Zn(2)-C6 fungal-type domain-containing protein n=1 Tax=Aspergillus wentii DTO 134E9 TaxID=1073089 RepID=A0A1L9RLV1_ASPWE|nr:uncharacterized protein ASPWEDRAFT_183896 [Aspergillus wentii DTO 134E9]OJJ35901.1 hypothetical protein ASPWEDRAFT_183896 [Aspergillus wentii DTO 134E9]